MEEARVRAGEGGGRSTDRGNGSGLGRSLARGGADSFVHATHVASALQSVAWAAHHSMVSQCVLPWRHLSPPHVPARRTTAIHVLFDKCSHGQRTCTVPHPVPSYGLYIRVTLKLDFQAPLANQLRVPNLCRSKTLQRARLAAASVWRWLQESL